MHATGARAASPDSISSRGLTNNSSPANPGLEGEELLKLNKLGVQGYVAFMAEEAFLKEADQFGLALIKDQSSRPGGQVWSNNLSRDIYFKDNPVREQVALICIKDRNKVMYEKLFNADRLPTKIDPEMEHNEAGDYFGSGSEKIWKRPRWSKLDNSKELRSIFTVDQKNSILSYVFIYKV